MRTEATYNAVMGSPIMTDEGRQIYYVLWSPQLQGRLVEGGLTKAEIAYNCELMGCKRNPDAPWEKVVGVLKKMGLVKQGNKRHCTVKNKEDATWQLTDAQEPVRPKADKPSAKAYVKGVAQLETLIAHHKSQGDHLITPELEKLYEWVRGKVPDQKKS